MGVHPNIAYDKFPEQGSYLGIAVSVCFNYNADQTIDGVVVRDDTEEPGHMIIQLSDGRVVLASECMYQPKRVTS